jgi:hypothetical protein
MARKAQFSTRRSPAGGRLVIRPRNGTFDETAIFVWLKAMAHRFRWRVILIAALVAASGCSKPQPPVVTSSPLPSPSAAAVAAAPTASNPSTPPADNFACTLLTTEEIQAVQGEPVKSTKPSAHTVGGMISSQCYFELPTPVNSVVLTVTRQSEGGREPGESWRETFHREPGATKKEEGEEKEPLEVEGIGDEAFWTGTRVGGALYVLKGNSYIRISVGGTGDQTQKIENSKKLAESVLKRL